MPAIGARMGPEVIVFLSCSFMPGFATMRKTLPNPRTVRIDGFAAAGLRAAARPAVLRAVARPAAGLRAVLRAAALRVPIVPREPAAGLRAPPRAVVRRAEPVLLVAMVRPPPCALLVAYAWSTSKP